MSESSFPPPIGEWTLETVKRIVAEHQHEPDWLDYKEVLVPHRDLPPEKKDEHRDSIRRCACAMANTNGGFIIFGVKDKGAAEDRLVGIDLTKDLRKQFGDLLDKIDPNIRGFDAKTIPFGTDKPGEGVWVVQLPVSPLRPHMLNGRFYRRTPGGKCEAMSAHEVRDQMILRETQLKRLEMLSLAFGQMQRTHDEMGRTSHPESVAARFDTDSLGFLIGETAGLLPPNLMRKLLHARHLAGCANRRFDWAQQAKALSEATGAKHKARYNLTTTEMGDLFNTLSECKRPLEDLVRSCLGKTN